MTEVQKYKASGTIYNCSLFIQPAPGLSSKNQHTNLILISEKYF